MNIKGRSVILRAIEPEDLPLMHRWANDPSIQQGLGGWHFPLSMEDHRKWLGSLGPTSLAQRFAIDVEGLGMIGTANLVDINWKDRNAFHGMMIGSTETRGKGYGHDTVMALMRYAFHELGLERLDGTMIEHNKASLALYLGKCGWKEEGRQRNWYFRQGRYWDRILVGITRADHEELLARTNYWA